MRLITFSLRRCTVFLIRVTKQFPDAAYGLSCLLSRSSSSFAFFYHAFLNGNKTSGSVCIGINRKPWVVKSANTTPSDRSLLGKTHVKHNVMTYDKYCTDRERCEFTSHYTQQKSTYTAMHTQRVMGRKGNSARTCLGSIMCFHSWTFGQTMLDFCFNWGRWSPPRLRTTLMQAHRSHRQYCIVSILPHIRQFLCTRVGYLQKHSMQ
jgi:hypothetical protein